MALRMHDPQELNDGKQADGVTLLAASCPHCGHTARHAIAHPADTSTKARAQSLSDARDVLAVEFPDGKCPVCKQSVDKE